VAFGNEVVAAAARAAARGRPVKLFALTFDRFAKGYAASLARKKSPFMKCCIYGVDWVSDRTHSASDGALGLRLRSAIFSAVAGPAIHIEQHAYLTLPISTSRSRETALARVHR
jgi:hypothetical protein